MLMRKKNLLISGLNGGLVVGVTAFVFAYVWSEVEWLREPKIMAISGFVYGFIVALVFKLTTSKFGTKAAILATLVITFSLVAGLLAVFK